MKNLQGENLKLLKIHEHIFHENILNKNKNLRVLFYNSGQTRKDKNKYGLFRDGKTTDCLNNENC